VTPDVAVRLELDLTPEEMQQLDARVRLITRAMAMLVVPVDKVTLVALISVVKMLHEDFTEAAKGTCPVCKETLDPPPPPDFPPMCGKCIQRALSGEELPKHRHVQEDSTKRLDELFGGN
jgi:hypothetical protein